MPSVLTDRVVSTSGRVPSQAVKAKRGSGPWQVLLPSLRACQALTWATLQLGGHLHRHRLGDLQGAPRLWEGSSGHCKPSPGRRFSRRRAQATFETVRQVVAGVLTSPRDSCIELHLISVVRAWAGTQPCEQPWSCRGLKPRHVQVLCSANSLLAQMTKAAEVPSCAWQAAVAAPARR